MKEPFYIKRFLPYSRQDIDKQDIEEVVKVLQSDYVTQGPKLKQFEEALRDKLNSKYSYTLANGTAALISACYALNIKSGDEVLVPCNSFVATANCVEYFGGKPILVDNEPRGFHFSLKDLEKKVTSKTVGCAVDKTSSCKTK